MNEQGKVKTKLPFFVLERLENDSITFNLKLNSIFNLVYSNLREKFYNPDVMINGKYDEYKYFTINKSFYQEYIDIVQVEVYKEYKISEANYFRKLLFQYCELPIFERERVLHLPNFKILEEAIDKKLRVRFEFNGKLRECEPYFLQTSEEFTYLFAYCLAQKSYRVFRISKINNLSITNKSIEFKNESEVIDYYENFDPFLSFGKEIKVRFTNDGEKKYNTIISNRPKKIRNHKNEYIFECSEKKAQVYFPQFFTDVEILEPQSLREWYRGKLKEALENYE